ncbi:hypothetical protein NPIL_10101, partial [Nephila pilipes]
LKTRNGYDLASAEGKAIQDVQEIYPEWQPEEPRPFVVFSEWKLPVDDNDHGRNYFIRFRFPMRTRDDLILDAIPMSFAWGSLSKTSFSEAVGETSSYN